MKRIILTSMILMLTLLTLQAAGKDKKKKHTRANDTTSYVTIKGQVVDSETKSPIVFASVFVTGSSIATVSNSDGEFVLKIPKEKKEGKVSFTHLGYVNNETSITNLMEQESIIQLVSRKTPIDEVVVRSLDPVELIRTAMQKVNENYPVQPEMQTSFYREAVKQNKKYVAVSEAVMDIYKAPYRNSFDADRLRVYKGRKSKDVKKMDTLMMKLQGGPTTSLLLDVVKNPGDLLHEDMLQYYNFELSGITTIDDRETYVVSFDQKDFVEYPLFKGNVYIDTENTAIAGLDFSISPKGLSYAAQHLIRKKPMNLKVDVEKGYYYIRYRKDNGNWYLNYVRSEVEFDTKWKKKLFKSKYSIMLEMAVTDRDHENVEKFSYRESAKMNDVFVDKVSYFEDDNYWGDYNTIKPDESIEVAIKKLNKKLMRK